MRFSQTFIPTLRDAPANADVPSHILLLRAGFIRQLGSGLFTWLPLGVRVLRKIEQIVREELTRRGAQEIVMPVVQPSELWRESDRWGTMGPDLLRMVDRNEREYCFSPTHEEVVTDLFRNNVNSYRQLPCNLFQINTKFRDEIRPRFGVLRSREFVMKDAYSFHLDQESFDETYRAMYEAYSAILERIGVDYRAVEADPGMIGDGESHEFHVLADTGEDSLVFSANGPYAANVERAEAIETGLRHDPTKQLARVDTPGIKSIESLAKFLNIASELTVKTLVVRGTDTLVALVLRGDHELNHLKTARLPDVCAPLEFASDAEIVEAIGCNAGSIGPVSLSLPIYIDRGASVLSDFVCGANENDVHFTGVNWERDVPCDRIVDIRNVNESDPAPDGTGPLFMRKGIEVGHIFQLGKKYTESMNASVLDQQGKDVHPLMGCYGIGITRMVAAVVEQCHDELGINWPLSVSPAAVHLIGLNMHRSEDVRNVSEEIYRRCSEANIDVLFDDRNERPGVKFADADLIGIPHRITVGERGLEEGVVEYRYRRNDTQKKTVDAVLERLQDQPD